MICKRCGNKIMYTREEYKGFTAIRCFHCDKWIKWATEDEKQVIPSRKDVAKEMRIKELEDIKAKYNKLKEIIKCSDYWEENS